MSWFSRTQEVTATASYEAVYMALAASLKEVVFLRQVQAFIVPALKDYAVHQ